MRSEAGGRRGDLRRRGHSRHGRLSQRQGHHRRIYQKFRSVRTCACDEADRKPYCAGTSRAPVQNGDSRAHLPRLDRFFRDGDTARRKYGQVFFHVRGGDVRGRAVLADVHQRAHTRDNNGQHPPQSAVQREHKRHRTALLPVHRGQDHAFPRQGEASDLRRAGGTAQYRNVHSGYEQFAAARRAGSDVPYGAGAGELPFRKIRLRDRVRLRRSDRTASHIGEQGGEKSLSRGTAQRQQRL